MFILRNSKVLMRATTYMNTHTLYVPTSYIYDVYDMYMHIAHLYIYIFIIVSLRTGEKGLFPFLSVILIQCTAFCAHSRKV